MAGPSWQFPPKTPEEFRERVNAVGLSEYVDRLLPLCRPSARLVAGKDGPNAEAAPTRLGGRPLLPASTKWPTAGDGEPLSFIAQLDCAALSNLLPTEPLPATGRLSFFYSAVEQKAWGYDPADADQSAVVYTPQAEPADLRDFPAGLHASGRFRPVALEPVVEWTFPPVESSDLEQTGIPEPWDTYREVLGRKREGDGTIHRLLGHPDPVQGNMQPECQLAGNGIYVGNGVRTSDPRTEELLAGATEWRLLLQIDSADDAGMMWGDTGRIYYWIRDRDLRAAAWKNAWLVFQCC